jgi:hypothetical protein
MIFRYGRAVELGSHLTWHVWSVITMTEEKILRQLISEDNFQMVKFLSPQPPHTT